MLSQDQSNQKIDVSERQTLTEVDSGCVNKLRIKAYVSIFLIALAARFLNLFLIDSLAIHANIEDSSIYLMGF